MDDRFLSSHPEFPAAATSFHCKRTLSGGAPRYFTEHVVFIVPAESEPVCSCEACDRFCPRCSCCCGRSSMGEASLWEPGSMTGRAGLQLSDKMLSSPSPCLRLAAESIYERKMSRSCHAETRTRCSALFQLFSLPSFTPVFFFIYIYHEGKW